MEQMRVGLVYDFFLRCYGAASDYGLKFDLKAVLLRSENCLVAMPINYCLSWDCSSALSVTRGATLEGTNFGMQIWIVFLPPSTLNTKWMGAMNKGTHARRVSIHFSVPHEIFCLKQTTSYHLDHKWIYMPQVTSTDPVFV